MHSVPFPAKSEFEIFSSRSASRWTVRIVILVLIFERQFELLILNLRAAEGVGGPCIHAKLTVPARDDRRRRVSGKNPCSALLVGHAEGTVFIGNRRNPIRPLGGVVEKRIVLHVRGFPLLVFREEHQLKIRLRLNEEFASIRVQAHDIGGTSE